jgi:4-diphosphocytidyl-2-C-methyl-D-erythritol kinase
MIIFSNAKINLGLFILSKRGDGFHDISSLKYPIPLNDVIEVLPSPTFQLEIIGKAINGELEDNLIWKAYTILKEKHNIGPVQIILQKNIPMGAGLGGGSSNATFVLKGLNDYFQLNLSNELLTTYAASLGSDCAFFVENKPQIATQKGDILTSFDLNLKGKFLYVIHPDIHVGTAEAYANVRPKNVEFNWESLKKLDFAWWRENLKNDFEDSIFPAHPEIEQVKEVLYRNGAVYVSMSGSGSAVFGIFEEKPKCVLENYTAQFILEL